MVQHAPIRIRLGTLPSGHALDWCDDRTVNAHWVLSGGSGSGKTYQLRRIVAAAADQGATLWIPDLHGDIECPGPATRTVTFSARSTAAVNPLQLDDDPDAGGVRNRINGFERLLSGTSHAMGPRQRPVLRRLLEDLYAARGFHANDPRSWRLDVDTRPAANRRHPKSHPTLLDLRRFIDNTHRRLRLGGDNQAMTALHTVVSEKRKLDRQVLERSRSGSTDTQAVDNAADKAGTAYTNAMEAIKQDPNTYAIEELLRFTSADIVASVADRIDTLESSGVFTGLPLSFPASIRVRRLHLAAIGDDEQRVLIETLLETIFRASRNQGIANHTRQFIVLDEAHRYFPRTASPDAIIPRIFREGRKFGLGMILASQQLDDMPDSVLASAGCKIILGVADMHQESLRRRLSLPMQRSPDGDMRNPLSLLQPKRTALASLLESGHSLPLTTIRIAS